MSSTTINLELPAKLYADLQTLAKEEQVDVVEVLSRMVVLARQSQAPTRAFQRIMEHAADLGISDLAEHHDHYLYGIEKE